MENLYQIVYDDLSQTSSTNPILITPPYNQNDDIKQKTKDAFKSLRRAIKVENRILSLVNAFYLGQLIEATESSVERTICRNLVTEHYRKIAIKTYYIYEVLGVLQIQRSKFITTSIILRLKKLDYKKLINDAVEFSQELPILEEENC